MSRMAPGPSDDDLTTAFVACYLAAYRRPASLSELKREAFVEARRLGESEADVRRVLDTPPDQILSLLVGPPTERARR